MENKTVFYDLPFYGAIIVQIYLFFVNSFDCKFHTISLKLVEFEISAHLSGFL